MFNKINHPELFQGHLNKKNYFEGWYYKYISFHQEVSLAVIPGISLNTEDAHAFIQVFISKNNQLETHYFKYPVDAFSFHPKMMLIDVAGSLFTPDEMILNIHQNDQDIIGHLTHKNKTPLKKSFLSPNIMGPFAYLPFMETKHGVISMAHDVSGSILFNDVGVSFNQTKGYMEKDWGQSFPIKYTWLQSNYFNTPTTSFFLSYATIKYMFLTFKGLICVLNIDGKEHRFATYNGAKVLSVTHTEKTVDIQIKKRSYKLIITGEVDKTMALPSPKHGKMNQTIKEGMSGRIDIKLYKKKTLIYEDKGYHSGIEIML